MVPNWAQTLSSGCRTRKRGWAMSEPEISRWTQPALPLGLRNLAESARLEGHEFVFRFEAEWLDRTCRFDGPGECLFIARSGQRIVGVSGICRDPYQQDPDVGRLRHVYVDAAFRSRGLGRELVFACLASTGTHFRIIRLKTVNPVAARIYERLGFCAVTKDSQSATHVLWRRDATS